MLLANISVAKKITEEFPDCAVLRRHPAPPPSNFDPLIKAASAMVSVSSHIDSRLHSRSLKSPF